MNEKDINNLKVFVEVWDDEGADGGLLMFVSKEDIDTFRKIAAKETPTQVTKSKYDIAFCPKCKGSVWQTKVESKYCFRCGQRLRWG